MRFSILLIAACATLFAVSCKKSKNTSTPVVKSLYDLNGISDATVNQYRDTFIYLALNTAHLSGEQEALTITPTGLPEGVTVSPSFLNGIPGFNGTFLFHLRSYTSGTIPVTITANSTSVGSKTFKYNIVVTPGGNCADFLTGVWDFADTASIDPAPRIRVVSKTSNTTEVGFYLATVISTWGNQDIYAIAHIDCNNRTFTLSSPVGAAVAVSGSGTYSQNQMTVNYTYILTGTPHTAIATFTR